MFKTILVHLRGVGGDAAALAAAQAVGQFFGAHLECLHVRPDLETLITRAGVLGGEYDTTAVTEALDALTEQSFEAVQRATDTFSTFCEKNQIPRAEFPPGPGRLNAAFRESVGDEVEALIEHSPGYDLLVVKSGYQEAGGLSFSEISHLITSAGRPILLAPDAAKPSLINNVVVAWKNVPEASRAVSAAMPLLEKAQKIFVMTADEEDGSPSDCDRIVSQLGWHGIDAEKYRIEVGQRDPGDAMLEMARAANADLLVMGAYGHSRLREMVVGGFTRAVLDDASLPVFMLH